MEKSLQRIQAAIIDGRSRTPRYAQKQLVILHDTLVQATSKVHQAIVQDTSCSSSEAWFEIQAALKAIKQQFSSINFKDVLNQEYSLAQGNDNLTRRAAYGCVYIVPSKHTRFYSTVQPIAAAIAAGNCVVIEMQQTLLEVDSVVRQLLVPVMDKDTFAIIDQQPQSENFFTEQVITAREASKEQSSNQTSSDRLVISPRRTIAVVDRSANVVQAAKDIVRARFRFGGRSPYAPDVVLVNEFALKEFCQAAVKFLTEELPETVTMNGSGKQQQANTTSFLQKALQQGGSTTLVSGVRGSIRLLEQRSDSILSQKVSEPLLIVNTISSLDDAIDSANTDTPLLAAYYFADPKAAKYLSQFITSDVSFTNHIPSQILLGPPAPKGFPITLGSRYTVEMFSRPSPEHITPPPDENSQTDFLDGPASKAAVAKLKTEIQRPLPDMGEPTTTSVGFFEQGLLTGAAIGGTVLFSAIGIGAWHAVPALVRYLRG